MFSQTYKYARRAVLCTVMLMVPLITHAEPPLTPGNFRYEIYSSSTIELFWDRTTNVPAQGYEITRNGSSLGIFDALSYVDNTLSSGIEYTYTISAITNDGSRSGLSRVVLQTPKTANTIAALENEVATLVAEVETLQSLLNDGVRSPVPQTGQRISQFAGDDGDFQSGLAWPDPRFTINVSALADINQDGICDEDEQCDGTITDNLTGLIWLQNANCYGTLSWYEAIAEAGNLVDDGSLRCNLSDSSEVGNWRLPNIKEIQRSSFSERSDRWSKRAACRILDIDINRL